MADFEFDPAKSESNLVKHGIDFISAQALWNDPDLLEIPARTDDEPRFLVIGRIGSTYWSGHHIPGQCHPAHFGSPVKT